MQPADPGEFGRRLRRLRDAAALSQEDLAERANLTAKAIGALERGERRRPYPNTVRALCDALGLDEAESAALAAAARPQPPQQTPPAPEGAGARAPAVRAPGSITVPSTPMLGRAGEVERLVGLLDAPETRVVTLTGPGGVGKTRLALELAGLLQLAARDVVLVELAGIRREDLVLPSIARAVGLQAGAEDLVGSVSALLEGRTPVLVLDNFEHLLGAATDVADLVARCPGLVVVATSRAPLRIRAELEVPVAPLPVPRSFHDVDAVVASPAAQMFQDRARRIVADFTVDGANATEVASICSRLDGLPLALELAAAHVRYLTPAQLLERLDHAVASGRLRDLPERQRTMTATLDWSHDLLTGDEQQLLHALSVFAGGFDLDAAEQVAAAPGRDVLSALEGLVEQSLVIGPTASDPQGAARYRLLEPVREYAAAALDPDAAIVLADRHAAYFVDLCVLAHGGLRSTDLSSWLDRLDAEHANVRAALTTLIDRGDLGAAAGIGGDTWVYWALRGHSGEGVTWWQRVLGRDVDAGGLDDRGRAAAHLAVAGLQLATGGIEGTRRHAVAAVHGARLARDEALLAEALVLSCTGAAFTGDTSAAGADLEELSAMGTDDPWLRAHRWIAGAQLALLQGELVECAAALDAAEELARQRAGAFSLATALNMRTTLALLTEDDTTALRSASEAAQLAAEVGTSWTLVYTLSALGTLASRRGSAELAVQLFAAAETTAEASIVQVAFRPDLESTEAHLRAVREELGDDGFERSWSLGRGLGIQDVLALLPELSPRPAPS